MHASYDLAYSGCMHRLGCYIITSLIRTMNPSSVGRDGFGNGSLSVFFSLSLPTWTVQLLIIGIKAKTSKYSLPLRQLKPLYVLLEYQMICLMISWRWRRQEEVHVCVCVFSVISICVPACLCCWCCALIHQRKVSPSGLPHCCLSENFFLSVSTNTHKQKESEVHAGSSRPATTPGLMYPAELRFHNWQLTAHALFLSPILLFFCLLSTSPSLLFSFPLYFSY